MFESFSTFLYVMFGFAVFCDVTALTVAACMRDKVRLERLVDLHTDVFAAVASTIIGMVRLVKRRDDSDPIPPPDTRQLR